MQDKQNLIQQFRIGNYEGHKIPHFRPIGLRDFNFRRPEYDLYFIFFPLNYTDQCFRIISL